MNKKTIITALFLIFSAPAGSTVIVADEATVARFKGEYPAAEKALEEKFAAMHGTCRLSDWVKGDDTPGSAGATFAAGHGYLKLCLTLEIPTEAAGEPREIVYCANQDSIFKLHRLEANGPYVVAAAGGAEGDLDEFEHRFRTYYTAPFSAFSQPFSHLLKDREFVITDAEPLESADGSLIRLTYRHGSPPEDKGTVIFDRGLGWVIKHFELVPGVGGV